jgi:RNA 2',3'-cyclic 3'-phosphodiesterase
MRLFVGVWPPDDVRERLVEVVDGFRDSHEGVRWEPPERWHVTLRFLGNVTDPDAVVEALDKAPLAPTEAKLGPGIGMLGRQVICVLVAGLDDLAAEVSRATAELGEPPEPRPFKGHLTLARLPGRRRPRRRRTGVGFTKEWLGTPVTGQWQVDEVRLVHSRPGPKGSTYDDLHVRRLGNG